MNCRQARARLVALIDDELAPSETTQVRHHLDRCAACRERHTRLLVDLPLAPVIALDPNARHRMHLDIDRALDAVDLAPPRSIEGLAGLRRALGSEIGVPRGLVILYAAALILAVGWAAGRAMPTPDVETLTHRTADADTAAKLELHRPAAYVPEGGWF